MTEFHITNKLAQKHRFKVLESACEQLGHKLFLANRIATNSPNSWFVSHPRRYRNHGNALYETGFFYRAVHIDTQGLWAESALNKPQALDQILSYVPPVPAYRVIAESPLSSPSKYPQPQETLSWDGVVLACQQPHDRSVTSVDPSRKADRYWAFVEGACRKYGRHLFLKLHPMHQAPAIKTHTRLAKRYGCGVGPANLSILDNCQFVLVYSSSFVVDCWLRGVPVAQFAPGYFHQLGGVTFCDGTYPDEVDDLTDRGLKIADFLIWRYCICEDMRPKDMARLFEVYSKSNELFPLPEELSYAAQHALARVGGY